MFETQRVTFTAGSGHLDRAAHLRDVSEELLRHRRAALVPVFHGRILIDEEESEPRLGWVPPLAKHVAEATEATVFLGLSGDTPCFAADFTAMAEHEVEARFCEGARFMELREIAARLGPASAAIAATAKGVLGWHATHPHCARCGAPTAPENGGWRRGCRACSAQHFPRTDPVVIMLVLRDDEVLLGRKPMFAPGLYSLLAGFVEPGETIEDAVRRETKEETSVEVGHVSYLGGQPWPYPANLMFGCLAGAQTTALKIDPNELEDAQWVSRAKMEVILAGKHPRLKPPRRDAIAWAILTDWVAGRIRLP